MRRFLRNSVIIKRFLSMDIETPDIIPVESEPKQNIEIIDEEYKRIIEGQAEVRVKKHVFYNPVQQFNRDLSVAVLTVFLEDYKAQQLLMKDQKSRQKINGCEQNRTEEQKPIEILEALAASGLRSIRYAKEVPNLTKIIANDISKQAVETMDYNIKYNNVDHLVETSHADACDLMYRHKHRNKRFAAVDLDPYGCPTTFLDAAVQCVQDGGLLLVTATDMAVLAGVVPETCYSKYGAISLKTKSCHEMALRILLMSIEQHANRYSRYIVPLLSIAADFYVRVFVQVFSGAAQCKKTTSKLSMVYHCVGCDTTTLQPLGGWKANAKASNPHLEKAYLPTGPPVSPLCEHCNQKHHLGGPIWSAPIHKPFFVSSLLTFVENNTERFSTSKRMEGTLSVIEEELNDVPLYYTQDKLFSSVHLESMPMLMLRSAILNGGFRVSYSHASRKSVKTDAPPRFLWDVIRCWEKEHPVKLDKKASDPVTRGILSQAAVWAVQLREREDANPASRRLGRLRFPANPAPHWGPGSRATVNTGDERQSKAIRNQNKYSNKNKDKRHLSPPSDEEPHKKQNTEELSSGNTTMNMDKKSLEPMENTDCKSDSTHVEIKDQ